VHTNLEDTLDVFMLNVIQGDVVFVTAGAGKDRSLFCCRRSDIR
jgi:hypothetical protein